MMLNHKHNACHPSNIKQAITKTKTASIAVAAAIQSQLKSGRRAQCIQLLAYVSSKDGQQTLSVWWDDT